MRRIDAYFTANPGAGLRLQEACQRFGCTGEQLYRALDKANRLLGLGVGMEPFFRLGPSSWATKSKRRRRTANGEKSAPIRPGAVSSSIFSGTPPRLRLTDGSSTEQHAVVVVERTDGVVRVKRIQPQDTEEWQERERARRARQKPPKPTSRTRGKKVRAWDGEATE